MCIRDSFDFLPLNNRERPPVLPSEDPADRPELSLNTLVPPDPHKPYDIKELINKVVDEGDFFELQPTYAGNIVIGFARMRANPITMLPA